MPAEAAAMRPTAWWKPRYLGLAGTRRPNLWWSMVGQCFKVVMTPFSHHQGGHRSPVMMTHGTQFVFCILHMPEISIQKLLGDICPKKIVKRLFGRCIPETSWRIDLTNIFHNYFSFFGGWYLLKLFLKQFVVSIFGKHIIPQGIFLFSANYPKT